MFLWVPVLRRFFGNKDHQLFVWGYKSEGFGWGTKVYVENVYVIFSLPYFGNWLDPRA